MSGGLLLMIIFYGSLYFAIGYGLSYWLSDNSVIFEDDYEVLCVLMWPIVLAIELIYETISLIRDVIKMIQKKGE